MLFYDFEVFKEDWLVVVIDMTKKKEHVIINDPDALSQLHKENIDEIINTDHVDGVLVGGASLKVDDWERILNCEVK